MTERTGDPTAADRIAREIVAIGARAVIIQHQPGLIQWDVLAEFVARRTPSGPRGHPEAFVITNSASLKRRTSTYYRAEIEAFTDGYQAGMGLASTSIWSTPEASKSARISSIL